MREKRHSFRFRDWRILTKLLVVMLVLSWVPLSMAVAFGVVNRVAASRAEMESNILRLTSDKVDEMQARVTGYVVEYQKTLQAVADNADVAAFLGAPNIERILSMDSAVATLTTLHASDSAIGYVAFVDSTGTVVASTVQSEVLSDHSHWPHVQAALDGTVATSGIHVGHKTGTPGFFLAIPVRRDTQVVGALVIRVEAEFILTMISETSDQTGDEYAAVEYEQVADVFLVNGEIMVVAHSNPESDWLYHTVGVFEPSGESDVGQQPLLEEGSGGTSGLPATGAIPAAQPLGDALLTAFESGEGDSIRYCRPRTIDASVDDRCSQGSWYIASYKPVNDPFRDEVLTIVVIDVPEEPFMAPVRTQTMATVGGAVLLAAFIIIASVVVARTVARPIRELEAAARIVEQEEPFEPDSIAGVTAQGDEIGRLARVFSDMVVAVQARERKLKEQVRELSIRIDQAKRKRHVDEIVEGEFFQDLQAKAQEMRGKRSMRQGDSSTEE